MAGEPVDAHGSTHLYKRWIPDRQHPVSFNDGMSGREHYSLRHTAVVPPGPLTQIFRE